VTKRQKRLLAAAIVLAVILLVLVGYFGFYRSTKKLSFNLLATNTGTQITPPQYLYMFSGDGSNRLINPVGVMVDGGRVYVADSRTGKIQVFNEQGDWQRSIGASESVTPLYIAKNPKNGNLYVTDRRTRSVHMYTTDGKYLGDFDPKLPKDQLPKSTTGGVQWVPLAIAFGQDGTMYATEILNGHRLLIFSPEGKFEKSVGTSAIVNQPTEAPGVFQFPNGLMVVGQELYIADSNNRRVQVFDLQGNFKRIIVTQGLPRGIAELGAMPSGDTSKSAHFLEVDTLAHDVTIWTNQGVKTLSFGTNGLLEGQFNYPIGIAVGSKNLIFVTDTSNARVQVWGWPEQVAALPIIGAPQRLVYCLIPLLLLPLLLLLRRRKFYATADFVQAIVDLDQTDLLKSLKRTKWVTTAEQKQGILAALGSEQDADLFEVWDYSEADAQAIMSKYDVDHDAAVILAVAQRTKLMCAEQSELRTVAMRMEIDVVNSLEFVKRFGKGSASADVDSGESGPTNATGSE
jgi:DNA-binding beta-propeller fold protein YncE